MQIGWFRVPTVVFLFLLVCGSVVVNAQNAPTPANTRVDRCIRWLNGIQPDPNMSAANFCRGLQTGNAGGHYSVKCHSTATIRGTLSPSHCNFAGLVTPSDTLAVDFRTESASGWEFPNALTAFGANHYVAATFYSRTDFVVGEDRLPAGLYKLFTHKDDNGWVLDFARQDGEWDELLPAEHPSWHARMNSIGSTDTSKKLFADILVSPKGCRTASPAGTTVRELEFSFGTQDVSVCLSVNQAPPSAPEELSKR